VFRSTYKMSDRVSEDLEKSFRKLVTDLIPSDGHIAYGTRLVEQVT